jgi:hypothetical protein
MEQLIETITVSSEHIAPIKLSEEKIEAENSSTDSSVAGGYKVPVWRLDQKNANGRTYPSALAERLVSEAPITYALDGHPRTESDVSFEDVKAIGKNPTIEDGILWAEAYFVDNDYYKKIESIIEQGSTIGLSSVGWGELDENGTINAETYHLSRYFDFVLNPSYSVYITQDTPKTESSDDTDASSTEGASDLVASSVVSEDEFDFWNTVHTIKEKRRK